VNHEREQQSLEPCLTRALAAAHRAGTAILEIYDSGRDVDLEIKADDSPLTLADRTSHDIISGLLAAPAGSLPLLSEEGKAIPYEQRKGWTRFWLVDPLDGTREFVGRNGEFTVNIALIQDGRPVLGVVYVPVTGMMYFAAEGAGAWRVRVGHGGDVSEDFFHGVSGGASIDALVRAAHPLPDESAARKAAGKHVVVASRSHMNHETEEYIAALERRHSGVELISAGSSLKLCLVAEGSARCYPRLGPTMEWATAAAHAVVNGAGKRVAVFDSDEELRYNKENLLNPWFVVT
jgi:3'(2'), 5'-bisphosphate nucleotidase